MGNLPGFVVAAVLIALVPGPATALVSSAKADPARRNPRRGVRRRMERTMGGFLIAIGIRTAIEGV